MAAPHPLARRIHDDVLQLLGTALMKSEMCEQLVELGRVDDLPMHLEDLRDALEQAVAELRGVMAELRQAPQDPAAVADS
jgi:signal transduction histidine kinase